MFEYFLMANNLICKNQYDVPTFMNHNGKSVIDLVLVSDNIDNRVTETSVEINTVSAHRGAHRSVTFGYRDADGTSTKSGFVKESVRVLDFRKLNKLVSHGVLEEMRKQFENVENANDLEGRIRDFNESLIHSVDASSKIKEVKINNW